MTAETTTTVIRNLAAILKKAQHRIDAETGRPIDVGRQVQYIKHEFVRMQKDAERVQKEIEEWRTTSQNLLEQMLDEIRRGDRFADTLEEIANLPDVRCDEAALIARKALA